MNEITAYNKQVAPPELINTLRSCYKQCAPTELKNNSILITRSVYEARYSFCKQAVNIEFKKTKLNDDIEDSWAIRNKAAPPELEETFSRLLYPFTL